MGRWARAMKNDVVAQGNNGEREWRAEWRTTMASQAMEGLGVIHRNGEEKVKPKIQHPS